MWQELLTILRKLGNDYSVVAALGKEKHKALVGVDMKTLDRLVKREADMAASIKKTESARQELCLKIIKAYPSITNHTGSSSGRQGTISSSPGG